MSYSTTLPGRQRGAVLIVSLILLLVMTILALSGSQVVRLQERMAGNVRDTDLAFQGSEAALRDAERYIEALTAWPTACTTTSTAGCMMFETGTLRTTTSPAFDLRTQNNTWWTTYARDYQTTATTDLAGVKRDPKFVIEKVAQVCDTGEAPCAEADTLYYFRNTAQSYGGTDTADVRLQSTYVRRGL
ncbi:MAG TPA: PilX N-terminal domain-containing pilus assembly protein [Povalibacter sp.]|nr:PilX N-terminal domain-containing pilus assembly protein [Povalibacter sp.]